MLVHVMLRLHVLQSLAELFGFPSMLFERGFQGCKLFAKIVMRLGFLRQFVFRRGQAVLQTTELLLELIAFLA